MKKEIAALRSEMEKHGIDAYLVPTTDFHGSEYINDYFKCREFLSGFTGSAGTLVTTQEEACLWTDGRYFLQAGMQLEGSGIHLMKMGEPGVPTIEEYLAKVLHKGSCLGFDGRVIDMNTGKKFSDTYHLVYDLDLTDNIWKDRPVISPSVIYPIPDSVTGESSASKLSRIRKAMKTAGADYHLITSLEDIAWIYNLRGDDVENTPVFYAYTLITMDSAKLYVMDKKLKSAETAEVLPYEQILSDIAALKPGKLLLNAEKANYSLFRTIPDQVEIIDRPDPSEMMKAVKNDTEITSTKNAHRKDGIAMVNFLYWIKSNVGNLPMTELSAASYLLGCRAAQDGFHDVSFETISGYASDGAIIHYAPTPESDRQIEPEGFLLVDSGGQYCDGTTDITRTIAVGPLTSEMKRDYTAVLRCHLRLAMARFEKTTLCTELDAMTREPLHEIGYNYNHGTGHGVGHMLSVHEGPQSISPRGKDSTLQPGMITSNEPGVYLEGKYGIRIETETLTREAEDGMLYLETLTLCPYEREAILTEALTSEERAWIDNYHERVYTALHPYLKKEVQDWLREVTLPL